MIQSYLSHKDVSNIVISTVSLVTIIILCKLCEAKDTPSDPDISKSLLEQSYKWYLLSEQDTDNMTTFKHCNFAVAYLNAARHSASDTELERSTKINVHKYSKKLHEKMNKKGKIKNQVSWLKN